MRRCARRLRDLTAAVQRCRRLLDLDADPAAPAEHLAGDPLLAPLVAPRPGCACPERWTAPSSRSAPCWGSRSPSCSRTAAGAPHAGAGEPLPAPDGALTHLFPTPAAIAAAAPEELRAARAPAPNAAALARLLAEGELAIDPAATARKCARVCSAPRGGAVDTEYIAMRALADPDAFLPTDLGVRRALEALGSLANPMFEGAPPQRGGARRGTPRVWQSAGGRARVRAGSTCGAPSPPPDPNRLLPQQALQTLTLRDVSMTDAIQGPVLKLHQQLYERSDGMVGHRMLGVPALLLRSTGRRTGAQRCNALIYAADGGDYVVVASNGGSDSAPGWLL